MSLILIESSRTDSKKRILVKFNGCLKSGQQISFIWAAKLLLWAATSLYFWAAKIIFYGQRNYFFEQQDYLFGQQILMEKAADFTGIGSNFC